MTKEEYLVKEVVGTGKSGRLDSRISALENRAVIHPRGKSFFCWDGIANTGSPIAKPRGNSMQISS